METTIPLAETLSQYYDEIQVAAKMVISHLGKADVAVVLGSGLSSFSSNLHSTKTISYTDIPHMPRTTVPGHSGELIIGELPTKFGTPLRILCFSGRVHWYEGFTFEQVNFLVRLAAACGCSSCVLTNSAGGAIPHMKPGSAMIIKDHIRFTRIGFVAFLRTSYNFLTSCNLDPLRNVVADHRICRPNTESTGLYSERLIKLAKDAAEKLGEVVYEGVYCWCGGPTYESPAEVQAGMRIGADAFGMSTVPEVLAGNAIGLEIFGISLCTNMACGLQRDEKLLHADVVRVAKESGPRFEKLLLEFFYNFEPPALSCNLFAEFDSKRKSILERQHILPVHGLWAGSYGVNSDVALLKSSLKKDSYQIGVFFDSSSNSEFLASKLKGAEAVNFSDLPSFVATSPNVAYKGHIFSLDSNLMFGDPNDVSMLIVEHNATFRPILDTESHYLIGLLSGLGVQRIVQIVSAESETGAQGWFSINDFVDLTNDRTYPGFVPTLKCLDSSVFADLPLASLCVFPGPTPPTPTEIKLTKVFETSVYTCTTLSPVYSALQSGLNCSVIACANSPTLPDPCNLLLMILNSVNSHRELVKSAWQCEIPTLQYRQSFQENPAHVKTAAAEIKGALMPTMDGVDIAVVIDSPLSSVVTDIKWRSSVSVEHVQNWKQDLGTDWRLSIGDWPNGKAFLCLHSSNRGLECDQLPLYDATFAVRVFKALNIGTVVFVGVGIAAEPSIAVGSIVGVSDHVNCSGENPLFGPNEEEFGTRFPDLARMYSPVPSVSNHAVLGYLPNASAFSSKFAEHLGFQVYCYNLIPETLVARHSGMSIFSLLWIAGSCVSYEKTEINDSARKEIISALCHILS